MLVYPCCFGQRKWFWHLAFIISIIRVSIISNNIRVRVKLNFI